MSCVFKCSSVEKTDEESELFSAMFLLGGNFFLHFCIGERIKQKASNRPPPQFTLDSFGWHRDSLCNTFRSPSRERSSPTGSERLQVSARYLPSEKRAVLLPAHVHEKKTLLNPFKVESGAGGPHPEGNRCQFSHRV